MDLSAWIILGFVLYLVLHEVRKIIGITDARVKARVKIKKNSPKRDLK